MRFFVKIILIAGIALFGLINLRAYSFDKGLSKTKYDKDAGIVEIITTIADLEEVEYYKSSFASGEYVYNVYLKTKGDCYLLKATEEDIQAFSLVGVFSNSFKPEKINPIPVYVYGIVMFIILVLPGKRRSKK